jgi:EAL and modified HD-GYP domain-containing signal transduction protein
VELQDIYLARQPIVDGKGELSGYELLFRSAGADASEHDDSVLATSTVVANVFTDIGLPDVVGEHDAYLNVDIDFLFSDLVLALPPKRIVLELAEKSVLDAPAEERCRELRKRGYRIALDGFVGNLDEHAALLPLVDMVKIDFHAIDPLLVPMIVKMVRRFAVRTVAEKVETPEQFEQARTLGVDLFQGFHFARPQFITAKRAKPAKLALLRLLSLAMDDGELKPIEDEFKRHPSLALNLLRLVNSAAAGQRQTVTSLRHALVLLGRKQLRIWLQLLLYTADRGNASMASPLLQLAAVRGKLMELVATRCDGRKDETSELAFITGILSLMDVLLEMPLEEILKELPLPAPVERALLAREGQVGDLLAMAEGLERGDTNDVRSEIGRLGRIDSAEIAQMQVHAYRWANGLLAAA